LGAGLNGSPTTGFLAPSDTAVVASDDQAQPIPKGAQWPGWQSRSRLWSQDSQTPSGRADLAEACNFCLQIRRPEAQIMRQRTGVLALDFDAAGLLNVRIQGRPLAVVGGRIQAAGLVLSPPSHNMKACRGIKIRRPNRRFGISFLPRAK
jgi:hypothetical protein